MAEKVATASIYMDIVANGDLCKVVTEGVGTGYKIYVFDGQVYLPFNSNRESMSFEDACKYLKAVYDAVYTINQKPITDTIFRNQAVRFVMQYANLVFRRGYERGYAEAKAAYDKSRDRYERTKSKQDEDEIIKYKEKIEMLLSLMSRNDVLQLTRNLELAQSRGNIAKELLDVAVRESNIATSTLSEFEKKKAEYTQRIQTEGIVSTTRR